MSVYSSTLLAGTRRFAKFLAGWPAYQSSIVQASLAEQQADIGDADVVYSLSWTTLEAAHYISKKKNIPAIWVVLSGRIALQAGIPIFANQASRRFPVKLSRLAQQVSDIISDIHACHVFPQIVVSPRMHVLEIFGVETAQVHQFTTLQESAEFKIQKNHKSRAALVLVDTPFRRKSVIDRYIASLLSYFSSVEVVIISDHTIVADYKNTVLGNDKINIVYLQPKKLSIAERQRLTWGKIFKLRSLPLKPKQNGVSLKRKNFKKLFTILARKKKQGGAYISRKFHRWDRLTVSFLRKNFSIQFLKAYFFLKGVHVLETEMDNFRHNLSMISENLDFEVVHSMDLISAYSGCVLAEQTSARHVVDINEFPLFEYRPAWVFRSLPTNHLRRLYRRVSIPVLNSDAVIAVSSGIARLSERKFKSPVVSVRNFRAYRKLGRGNDIASEWGIPKDHTLLVHVCTIAEAYRSEIAILMMRFLPETFHIVFVGAISTPAYKEKFENIIETEGLSQRVHMKDEIVGDEKYMGYIGSADIGISILDSSLPLPRLTITNRVSDLLAAGLPIVSSFSHETNRIVKEFSAGRVVRSDDPELFAAAVLNLADEIRKNRMTIQKNLTRLRKGHTWNGEIKKYLRLVLRQSRRKKVRGKSVAFVFQRGILRNRRVLRFAQEFLAQNYKVVVFCSSLPPPDFQSLEPKIKFVRIPPRSIFPAWKVKEIRRDLAVLFAPDRLPDKPPRQKSPSA